MDMDFLSLMGFSALGSKELDMTEWLYPKLQERQRAN